MPHIVTISGTSRPDNYTARALAIVSQKLAAQPGVRLTEFDARTLELAFPGAEPTADAQRLVAAVEAADAIVLATPEYHGGFAAMTKLIIENLGFPSKLSGKPIGLLGVAAGRIGAIKSLEQLRGVCSHVGAIVIPGSISLAGVRSLFDDAGHCTDAATEQALGKLAESVVSFLHDYVCPKHTLEAMVREGAEPWASAV